MVAHRLDGATARALAIPSGGAMLLRPGGVPVGTWAPQAESLCLTPSLAGVA